MRVDLRAKAMLVTGLLSLVLLGLGFEMGWLLSSRQVDEANSLTSQATDKVLALTQEKQALEQSLRDAMAQRRGDSLGEVWRQDKHFCGLARRGQKVIFNRELQVELVAVSAEQAELNLLWQGQRTNIALGSGEQLDLANHWRLVLQHLGDNWVVMILRQD